jgi:hypothetical protein
LLATRSAERRTAEKRAVSQTIGSGPASVFWSCASGESC